MISQRDIIHERTKMDVVVWSWENLHSRRTEGILDALGSFRVSKNGLI